MGRRARDGDAGDWLRAVPGQGALRGLLLALDGTKCCPAACSSASISAPALPAWRAHLYLRAHFQLAHCWVRCSLTQPQGITEQGQAGTCKVSPAELGVTRVQPPTHLQHFCLIGDYFLPARNSLSQGIGKWVFFLALLLG